MTEGMMEQAGRRTGIKWHRSQPKAPAEATAKNGGGLATGL
jgi:hypothetical protein